MPRKGYRPTRAHRQHLADAKRGYHARVKDALAHYKPPANITMKGTAPRHKADPVATPIPPSAGKITADLPQRWAVYSRNDAGAYFYKREEADTLIHLQRVIRELSLPYPLWAYVKSGRTKEELGSLPIRIPDSALPTLGQRFQPLKEKKK